MWDDDKFDRIMADLILSNLNNENRPLINKLKKSYPNIPVQKRILFEIDRLKQLEKKRKIEEREYEERKRKRQEEEQRSRELNNSRKRAKEVRDRNYRDREDDSDVPEGEVILGPIIQIG